MKFQTSKFQLHDLVRVKEQPKMQNVQIKGLMAVITEISGEHCTIHELQLDGRLYGGSGAVELACLEKPEVSAPWRAAFAVYKQNQLKEDAMMAEGENVSKRRKRRRAMKLVAERHKLDPAVLKEIMKDLQAAEVILIFRRLRAS